MLPSIFRASFIGMFACAGLGVACVYAQHPVGAKSALAAPKIEESTLAHEIRHQLSVLPYYSVFDYVSFTLDGGKVTLSGQVLRRTLRSDAEAAVKSMEGVTSVSNLIEVLPKSASDDDLRRAVYRVIFEDSTLQRYGIPDVPTIHILLRDGVVTLEGIVGSEQEKHTAGARAAGVAGIAGVKNNLSVRARELPVN